MKFAGSRSLWHGTDACSGWAGSSAAWIRRAPSRSVPNAPGTLAPRAAAVAARGGGGGGRPGDRARALGWRPDAAGDAGAGGRGGGGGETDDAPGREGVGDRRPAVNVPQRDRDLRDHVGPAEVVAAERAA